jgi:predicted MFS family arabinose efflux permease
LGIIVGCGGIGALIGSVLTGWLPRRASLGKVMIVALLCSGVINLLIPLAGGSPQFAALVLIAGQIIGDAAMMVFFVNETSLCQMIVPHRLQGRVGASFGFLAQGIAPVGALVAGGLATAFGSRVTLWIAALGILAAAIWMAVSPIKRLDGISATDDTDVNVELEPI